MLAGIRADNSPGPPDPANLPDRDQQRRRQQQPPAPALLELWAGSPTGVLGCFRLL